MSEPEHRPSPQPQPQPQAASDAAALSPPERSRIPEVVADRAATSTHHDVAVAARVAVVLAVLGAVLGLVWSAWSPPGPRALVLTPGVRQPDETEAFVAGDARYLILSLVVGILAGLLAWTRKGNRGPWMLAALALGGVVGALLMEFVGHLTGGGTFDGKPNTIIEQLPLSLHLSGFRYLEAGLAVLVYGMLVAFAVRDDLGRPDPIRDVLAPATMGAPPSAPWPEASVGAGHHPQDGGGHSNAPGPLQQRDLPAQ